MVAVTRQNNNIHQNICDSTVSPKQCSNFNYKKSHENVSKSSTAKFWKSTEDLVINKIKMLMRNCEMWETYFLVHLNLVYISNNSTSLVIASQDECLKPVARKNYRERNMSLIYWPEGQKVDL